MKTMTCKQLGGACEEEFTAATFTELAEISKHHGMQMFQKGDESHLKAMKKMQALMEDPNASQEWFDKKRKEFESLDMD